MFGKARRMQKRGDVGGVKNKTRVTFVIHQLGQVGTSDKLLNFNVALNGDASQGCCDDFGRN